MPEGVIQQEAVPARVIDLSIGSIVLKSRHEDGRGEGFTVSEMYENPETRSCIEPMLKNRDEMIASGIDPEVALDWTIGSYALQKEQVEGSHGDKYVRRESDTAIAQPAEAGLEKK